ncbi:MAG: hypothetical protein ACR2OE_09075 [Thermomicrobiales bacterium]
METARGRSTDRVFVIVVMGLVLALVASMSLVGRSFAQSATPAATPAAAVAPVSIAPDLAVITVTAKEDVFSIAVPTSGVIEGDFAVELVNKTANKITNANFVKLPEGTSVGDFTSVLAKAFKGEGGELPAWWSSAKATFAGGTFAAPGNTSQSIVNLSAGRWVVFSSNPAGVQSAQVINVVTAAEANGETAATPVPGATPVAAASPVAKSLPSDNQFTITGSGFDTASDLSAGQKVFEVTNTTNQVRDLVIIKVEGTVDEAAATKLAGAFSRGDTVNGLVVGGVGALSPHGVAYAGAALESGTYVIFSSLPDASGGLQSAHGAVKVVTVP